MAEGFEAGTPSPDTTRGPPSPADKRPKLTHRSHPDCPPHRHHHQRDVADTALQPPMYGPSEHGTTPPLPSSSPSPSPPQSRRHSQRDDHDGAEMQTTCPSLKDFLHADGGIYLERLHEMIERQKDEWLRSRDQQSPVAPTDFSPRPNAAPLGQESGHCRQFVQENQKEYMTASTHSAANQTESFLMTEPDPAGTGRGQPGRVDHAECGSWQPSDHRHPTGQQSHRQQTEPLMSETGKSGLSKTVEPANPAAFGAQQQRSHTPQSTTPRSPRVADTVGHKDHEQARGKSHPGEYRRQAPSFEEQLCAEFEILKALAKSLKSTGPNNARSSPPSLAAPCFENCVISEMRSIRSQCLAYSQTLDPSTRQLPRQLQQHQQSIPAVAQQEQRAGGAQSIGPITPFEQEVLALVRNLRQAHERSLILTLGRGQIGGGFTPTVSGGHQDASTPTSFEDMVLGKLRELNVHIVGLQTNATSVHWPKTHAGGHEAFAANRTPPPPTLPLPPPSGHHHHHRLEDGAEIVTTRATQTGSVNAASPASQHDKAVNTTTGIAYDLPLSTPGHGQLSHPPHPLDINIDPSARNDQIHPDARKKPHENLVHGKKYFEDDLRRDDFCEEEDVGRPPESAYRAPKSGSYRNTHQPRPCPNVSFREPLTDIDCAKILASDCEESSDECGDVIEEGDVDGCDLMRPPDRLPVFQNQYGNEHVNTKYSAPGTPYINPNLAQCSPTVPPELNSSSFQRFQYQMPNGQTPAPLELSQYVLPVPQQMAFHPTQNQIPRIQSANVANLPILEIPQNSYGVIQCQTPGIQSAVPNLSQYPISETPMTPYSIIIQGQTPGIQTMAPNLSQYPIAETPLTPFNVIQGQTLGFQQAASNLSQYPISETPIASFSGIQCQTPGIQQTAPNLSQYPISETPITSQYQAPGTQPAVPNFPQFPISESPTKGNNMISSFVPESNYSSRFQSDSPLDCDRYKSRVGADPSAVRQPLTSSMKPGEIQPVHLPSPTEQRISPPSYAGHLHSGPTKIDCERFNTKEPLRSSSKPPSSRRIYDDCVDPSSSSTRYEALDRNTPEEQRSHRWTKVALDGCNQDDEEEDAALWWDCGPKDEPPPFRSSSFDCDALSSGLDRASSAAGNGCEQQNRRPPSYCEGADAGRSPYPNSRTSTELFKQLNAWCRRGGHGQAATAKGGSAGGSKRLRRQSPSSCVTSTASYRTNAKRPLSKGRDRKLDCREILAAADNLCPPKYDPCAFSPSDSDC